MFANLVTYHVYRRPAEGAGPTPLDRSGQELPPYDALAYQYLLAGNGVFIRLQTTFFHSLIPIATCAVRGLAPLHFYFQLQVPRIPERLLATVLADARRARRPDGDLSEALYHFHHLGHAVQVKKPPQRATGDSILAPGGSHPAVLCELHSHGNMRAFWSPTDDGDEQAARLYAVIGRLDTTPEIRLRVGAYGYWHPLPLTAVFTGAGGFIDLHLKENNSCPLLPTQT
ncbi:MAG: hypothetical protein L0332_18000 [Chloroflexi bacterium]|nr:hypothetical protein [Chloroflexota bacterium]MCI0728594.1 hypothetical protein [Chloroflexota bacterium]